MTGARRRRDPPRNCFKRAGHPLACRLPPGFPTLVVIDQEGVVRDVHVGYSPTLKEEVVQSVERLLKAKP